jgi:crossover junction endodeoxyribonuclease RuvC
VIYNGAAVIYIGIDPGLNGAVAVIAEAGNPLVFDTPTMVVSGVKEKRVYNTAAMAVLLKPYGRMGMRDTLVILENVHSMPKQGVASSFSFGQGLGMWQGIIAALGLPLEMPSPQRWKKEMLADQGKEKAAARFKAMQLFPAIAAQFARVKDDGRAEALLMAEYGRRLRSGK